MAQPIRVLVVDDSALMRHRLSIIINNTAGFEVAGSAGNGKECLAQLSRVRPDVITLDVEMPEMDGLTTLREIMQSSPTPVVMVSSLTEASTSTALEALARGAVDCVAKPTVISTDPTNSFTTELLAKISIAAQARMPRVTTQIDSPAPLPHPVSLKSAIQERTPFANQASMTVTRPQDGTLVVIGSSTGGPQALDCLFASLPDVPAAFLVVQHMPPMFTRSLAGRLARRTKLEVREGAEGDKIESGTVLVAQGGWHMTVSAQRHVHFDQRDPLHGVRPAIDYTLYSVAEHWKGRLLVVILTGMGVDGADGARILHNKGVQVFAQDEATSIVYGMPRAVAEAGAATEILPLEQIGPSIGRWVMTQNPVGLSVV